MTTPSQRSPAEDRPSVLQVEHVLHASRTELSKFCFIQRICGHGQVGPNEPDKNARFQEEFAKLATRWDADGNGTFSMDECKVMIRELTSQKGRIVYDMKNKVDS